MRSQLSAAPTVKAMRTEANRSAMQSQAANQYTPKKGGVPGYAWVVLSVLTCLFILAVAGIMWVQKHPESSIGFTINTPGSQESEQVSEQESVDPNMIHIPDLVGKFSEKYKEGEIAEQSPEVNVKANKGVTIVVKVSKGSANRELPVIAGQPVETAVKALNDIGFIASPGNYSASETVEAGKVIGYENYNAGDMAPYGAKISINISTGSDSGEG